jgi:hypothetical protein
MNAQRADNQRWSYVRPTKDTQTYVRKLAQWLGIALKRNEISLHHCRRIVERYINAYSMAWTPFALRHGVVLEGQPRISVEEDSDDDDDDHI